MTTRDIILGDNLIAMKAMKDESFRLIYIDPPFNTGKIQKRKRVVATKDDAGAVTGFGGQHYSMEETASPEFDDRFDDFITFMRPRLEEAYRLLTWDGTLMVHIDQREGHYVKVLLDEIFGRDSFINEIIWAYDYGGKSKSRWSAKHDTILCYAKDPDNYVFNYAAIDRVPYMAPDLVGPEKAALGKIPTDTWWITIVPTNGHEKTGYPTQKPMKLLNRVIKVHSDPGDTVLDFFAGSGTTGDAAWKNHRGFVLVDNSKDATDIMQKRLKDANPNMGYSYHDRTGDLYAITCLPTRQVIETISRQSGHIIHEPAIPAAE